MTVRPFDWRDLPTLYRFRRQSVFLDSALVLTRGPMLVPGALLSYLAPETGVFTGVLCEHEAADEPLIGQFIHLLGSQFARLTFLAPDAALDLAPVSALLEYMAWLSGERGALRLLADVDESKEAFDSLRQSGFAIYSRQRIWQFTSRFSSKRPPNAWRMISGQDVVAIRSLYNNLVPGLVQQAEPYLTQRPKGMVYYQEGGLLAYAEFRYGHRGIWLQPFVHPDAKDVPDLLFELLQKIPNRFSRPLYICVRSYQSWLESAIEELGAEAGPRRAVMVKHLVVPQKAVRAFAMPALEGGQPEVTAPIVRSESK